MKAIVLVLTLLAIGGAASGGVLGYFQYQDLQATRAQVEALTAENTELKQQKADLEITVDDLTGERDQLVTAHARTQQELEQLGSRYTSLERNYQTLQARYNQAQGDRSREVTDLKRENAEMRQALERVDYQARYLQTAFQTGANCPAHPQGNNGGGGLNWGTVIAGILSALAAVL